MRLCWFNEEGVEIFSSLGDPPKKGEEVTFFDKEERQVWKVASPPRRVIRKSKEKSLTSAFEVYGIPTHLTPIDQVNLLYFKTSQVDVKIDEINWGARTVTYTVDEYEISIARISSRVGSSQR